MVQNCQSVLQKPDRSVKLAQGIWSGLTLVVVDENLDLLTTRGALKKLKEKMLRFVPDESEKAKVSRMGFKEFEMYAVKHKDYLPLKEYSW